MTFYLNLKEKKYNLFKMKDIDSLELYFLFDYKKIKGHLAMFQ
jgi:hypothetical protein